MRTYYYHVVENDEDDKYIIIYDDKKNELNQLDFDNRFDLDFQLSFWLENDYKGEDSIAFEQYNDVP
jgi:hypothetical protein